MPLEQKLFSEIRGRDTITGLPKTITVSSDDVTEAIFDVLSGVIQGVKQVLQETPPELAADVIDKGMVLSGGTALLRNIDTLITQATGVTAFRADDPLLCVVKGTGIALDNFESYKRSLLTVK